MDALEEFQHLKIELKDIRSATANFHVWKVIGEGGFGKVYKALLSYSEGRSQVACKRLDPNRTYGQGDAEFWKEILLLSRYKHKNLISLLGFCNEEGERILLYELAYGSLDKQLSSTALTWRQRFKICLTAAKGLCYLHDPNGTQQRVIHRDIKSANILLFKDLSTSLDENCHAKIGDLGLSKLGPANQPLSLVATNALGTEGYIDPTFENTATLTKESDVYSFGVVLFEVFCGKLCGDYTSGRFENLVPKWKLSCKEEKSDDIIFHELKHDIDPSSLKTFLDIAYRCLEESREKRPKMSEVVEELDIALRSQEIYDQGEPPIDYEEISKTAIPCLVYESEEELKMLLSKGVFLNGGKTWFLLNGDGEHCEMISAAGCLNPIDDYVSSIYGKKSRFAVDYRNGAYFCNESEMHVTAQFLSPHITYTVNLVFDFYDTTWDNLGIQYKLAGEKKSFTSYLVDEGEDGWLISELFQFTSHRRQLDLEITFQCKNELVVDGIEFRPLERVEHQVLEDEEVDMPDTYWEQKLPSDYVDIIKWSKDNVQQATKKELYSILCEGFLINNGEEWFSLAKNGKKCHMLPASMALQEYEWRWRFSPDDSRFGEVAFDSHVSKFWISCKSKILSPQTTYGCYLVYKLQENHSGFERPLKISDVVNSVHGTRPWYIFLLTPQTPNIRRKVNQNTHNPLNRPRRKGLPQQRNDAWMEVQIWEFQTGATTESISKDLLLTYSEKKLLKGLILEGIELKPL